MRSRKRPAVLNPTIMLELASHATMGVALGLGLALVLTFTDAFGVASLIAHSREPGMTLTVFIGTSTLAFAVGATLTGFVFTMMEQG
jgi:hypothetical protein